MTTDPDKKASQQVIIEPGRSSAHYWRDLWTFRELFAMLAWRDISVRYKQTVIGVLWAVIKPVISIALLTFIFGNVAGLQATEAAPYVVVVAIGQVVWQLFSQAVSSSSSCLEAHRNMVSKVYLPRLMIPFSSMAVSVVDFLVSFAVLASILVWFDIVPSWKIVFLPLFIAFACLATMAVGLWFATLHVTYRDFRFIVPLVVQAGMFISPVAYATDRIRALENDWLLFIYSLNPMAAVIDGFRWAMLDGKYPGDYVMHWPAFACSVVLTLLLFWGAVSFFRRFERTFADVI